MLKIDRKIVKEFLGTEEVLEIISPLKMARLYFTDKCNLNETLLILTPFGRKGTWFEDAIADVEKLGLVVEQTEHKRGKNYVYTFKTSKKND